MSESKLDFPEADWLGVSKDAKDFVSRLIEPDVDKRYSIEKTLKHPWIIKHLRDSRAASSARRNNRDKASFAEKA